MISFAITPDYFVGKSTNLVTSHEVSGDIQVTVYPRWLKEITLEWSIPAEWGEPTFSVYRSASSDSGFEKLNTEQIVGNYWVDRNTDQDSGQRVDYYIVEAYLSTGVTVRSPVSYVSGARSNFVQIRANEISRREALMLRRYIGVPCVLMKRKTYGLRCPNCWSFKEEKVMKANCEECAGTSFKGGYFKGKLSYFQFEPSSKDTQFMYMGKVESNQTSAWTVSMPRLDNFDIIIRLSDFKIFHIAQVRQTELQGVTLRQMAALTELSHNHPSYHLINSYDLLKEALELSGVEITDINDDGGVVLGGSSISDI